MRKRFLIDLITDALFSVKPFFHCFVFHEFHGVDQADMADFADIGMIEQTLAELFMKIFRTDTGFFQDLLFPQYSLNGQRRAALS